MDEYWRLLVEGWASVGCWYCINHVHFSGRFVRHVNQWGCITFKVAPCLSSLPNASVNVIKHQLYPPAARGCLTFHAILSWWRNLWHQHHFQLVCHITVWLSRILSSVFVSMSDLKRDGRPYLIEPRNLLLVAQLYEARSDLMCRNQIIFYDCGSVSLNQFYFVSLFFPNVALKSVKHLFFMKCLLLNTI